MRKTPANKQEADRLWHEAKRAKERAEQLKADNDRRKNNLISQKATEQEDLNNYRTQKTNAERRFRDVNDILNTLANNVQGNINNANNAVSRVSDDFISAVKCTNWNPADFSRAFRANPVDEDALRVIRNEKTNLENSISTANSCVC